MTEANNRALWDRVCVTDPKEVKPITGKDYPGNSPKPYWIIRRLTEEFGPCGIGWGYSIDSERFERFGDTDTLHVARVTLWYVLDGKRGEITQMGQTKGSYVTSKGQFKLDEDAPKKSVTDALVKCASYLGFAGDIFSGRWDDSRYVAFANREWREREAQQDQPQPQPQQSASPAALVAADVADALGPARRDELDNMALYMIEDFKAGKTDRSIALYFELDDNDEKAYIWHQLRAEPKLRAAIKASRKEAA